jgi:NAD(P)-dependent dehydrogenase (short-subunit alcohol dehydrogenase family)
MINQVLRGKVALVAGATRGAGRGIAVELGAAGGTVYCTGRSTRMQASELNADAEKSARVMRAMLRMKKIEIDMLKRAYAG